MSQELELIHPRTFSHVSVPMAANSHIVVENIGKILFRQSKITWGKIICFMTIAAAIAADSAKVGHPRSIPLIIDATSSVITKEAGQWIQRKGGLNALTDHIRPIGSEHITFLGFLTVLTGFLLTVHWMWTILKCLGNQILNLIFVE